MGERSPLREQGFRLLAPVVGFVVGAAVLVTLWASELRDLLPWWGLLSVLVAGFALVLAATAVGLVLGRRLVGDKIEIALREDGGRWRHGRVELHGRTLTFLPYVWQIRVPTGEREEHQILSVDDSHARRPHARVLIALSPQVRVIPVQTPTRAMELAALPSRLQLIARAITSGSPQS